MAAFLRASQRWIMSHHRAISTRNKQVRDWQVVIQRGARHLLPNGSDLWNTCVSRACKLTGAPNDGPHLLCEERKAWSCMHTACSTKTGVQSSHHSVQKDSNHLSVLPLLCLRAEFMPLLWQHQTRPLCQKIRPAVVVVVPVCDIL